MYESPDQREPVFDAKGIETVRRDGCPAVSMVSTILVHVCSTRIYQVVVSLTTSQLSTKLYISHF